MSTFSDFQNILPDPVNKISYDGSASVNTGNTGGPGFASVKLMSNQPYLRDMTNSGRLLARSAVSHKWEISIDYNPMTRDEFDPVYSFLLQRRGPMNPFFVSLPQYQAPKDSNFATYSESTPLEAAGTYSAGVTSVLLGATGYAPEGGTPSGTPRPGDLFTIDGVNSNHKKAYMVTRVETNSNYQSGTTAPASNQVRIHFNPSLQKGVATGDDFIFSNPLIRVVLNSDVQEYSLNTNNLYSFSLKLEEVQ